MNLNKRSRHGQVFFSHHHTRVVSEKDASAGNFKALPTRYSPCMLELVRNPNQGGIYLRK